MAAPHETSDAIAKLPWYLIWSAFGLSVSLTLLRLFELVSKFSSRPKVEFHLTREVFFRVLDSGEHIYAAGVSIARKSPVLIRSVNFTLTLKGQNRKEFALKVTNFGARVNDNDQPYYFYSSSPLTYLNPYLANSTVYLCTQSMYSDRLTSIMRTFFSQIPDWRSRANLFSATEDAMGMAALVSEIDAEKLSTAGKIMSLVQLEPGDYDLSANLVYETKRLLPWQNKTGKVESRISFTVEEHAREFISSQIHQALDNALRQDDVVKTINVVYLPVNIAEG